MKRSKYSVSKKFKKDWNKAIDSFMTPVTYVDRVHDEVYSKATVETTENEMMALDWEFQYRTTPVAPDSSLQPGDLSYQMPF